jgi:hypothetical protein
MVVWVGGELVLVKICLSGPRLNHQPKTPKNTQITKKSKNRKYKKKTLKKIQKTKKK